MLRAPERCGRGGARTSRPRRGARRDPIPREDLPPQCATRSRRCLRCGRNACPLGVEVTAVSHRPRSATAAGMGRATRPTLRRLARACSGEPMTSKQAPSKRRARSRTDAATMTESEPARRDEREAEARWRRTAVAAFFRAEARGFAPGRELDDWLEAERELDALEAARRDAPAAAEPASSGVKRGSAKPDRTPSKRAASKRSKPTRGAPMQARNRGNES